VLAHTAIVAAALLVVEVNHRSQLGPWLYVTPDFQYIFRPGGSDEEPDAAVFGPEIGVDFCSDAAGTPAQPAARRMTPRAVSRSLTASGRRSGGWDMTSGIVASILDCDFTRLGDEVRAVDAYVERFQVDVMDGHFVPNLSFGFPILRAMRRLTKKPLEADLMIANPDRWAGKYAEAGADFVIIHVEASQNPSRSFKEIRDAGGRPGISLSPGTPAAAVFDHLGEVDMILVMTVHPGFGGQGFMSEQLRVVEQIRAKLGEAGRDVPIEVDGGIKPETARLAAAAGVGLFVSGSFIFGSKDYERAIATLEESIR
jgi:ribulose-phosphate 3-epimerase